MEKKELIKVENAAIRAAGSRMANMFQPMGEHEDDKEVRRAFYEGFQEGAAYYRLLIRRIDDEFTNPIEGVRLDSGPEEDTHSVMEMCLKNGIPVITTVQKAPGKKETEKLREDVKNYIATVPLDMSPEEAKKFAEEDTEESEPDESSKDDSAVPDTMEDCIKANPIEKIANLLANLEIRCIHEGNEHIHYIRFSRSFVSYTVYFEKQEDGFYTAVFSKNDEHGGEVLWDGIISNILIQMKLEYNITEHVKGL